MSDDRGQGVCSQKRGVAQIARITQNIYYITSKETKTLRGLKAVLRQAQEPGRETTLAVGVF